MFKTFKHWFIVISGYSYTHLGRMFLRMFVGVMLMQFGVRQIYGFHSWSLIFPSLLGLSPEAGLILTIIVEILCSLCIMVGFFTRLMIIPPYILMIGMLVSQLQSDPMQAADLMTLQPAGFVPMMFLGIYSFILLVGPGKISFDYFIALHFIHTDNKSEAVLEEV